MSSDDQRVMVVDDEPDILTVLEIFLKKWEYKVNMFSSPRQALEHFEKKRLHLFRRPDRHPDARHERPRARRQDAKDKARCQDNTDDGL